MSRMQHLPGAVEPVIDVKPRPPHLIDPRDIQPRVITAPLSQTEDNQFVLRRRTTTLEPMKTDTSQVRMQLERIATILEDSFKRAELRRQNMQLAAKEKEQTRKRPEAHSMAAGQYYSPPPTALPRLSAASKKDLKVNPTQSAPKLRPIIGGAPISEDLARRLRKVVYGSTVHSFSKEWRAAGFRFHFQETPYPYGLITEKNGSRGLILCVQAFIIKHLVFKYKTKEEIFARKTLQPSTYERTQALAKAMSYILWRAGDSERACLCLPSEHNCFNTSELYRADGITERLHLFDFRSYEELEMFVKRYLNYFDTIDGINGCILFLYSVVLSKTLHRVEIEMQGQKQLLDDYEELSQAIVNLILTGSATPYLHNDTLVYDEFGEVLAKPLIGVPHRSEVGFFFWNKDEPDRERTQVGSMLKTPKNPIWVTRLNGTYGLLFSINPDLVCDWRVEHKFQLHYYSGSKTQTQAAILGVDTRFGRKVRAKTARSRRDEQKRIPAVEQAILSKWFGAEVDWHGIMAFV